MSTTTGITCTSKKIESLLHTSANSAQTNDETGSECNKAEYVFHLKLLRIKVNG
jgi:hypothetical protein